VAVSSAWRKGGVRDEKLKGRNQSRTQYKSGSDEAEEYFRAI